MLGEKFRELRKAQKKSISEIAKDITSTSSLSRWECGEGEMSMTRVVMLLNKLHITPKEFMDIVDGESDKFYEIKVSMYYERNDIEGLKELAEATKDYHLKHIADKKYLFQNAIACNYYMDLTGQNLFSEDDVMRLKAYLLPIENWTEEDILLFGNTQLLLPADDIYAISRSIYSHLMDHEPAKNFYLMSLNTLLNGIFCLLKKKRPDLANNLLKNVNSLDIPDNFTNEKIRIKFMQALLNYINKKDVSSMKTLIQGMQALDLSEKVADFKFAFNQIRAVYD